MHTVVNIYDPETDTTIINGFTIVVDVFRAFTVSYFIIANNPKKYIAVDNIELAFLLKQQYSDSLLIGERKGIKIEGFDYGNSPTEIVNRDFTNKIVIHTTTAGTKGLIRQPDYNTVIVGSFVNANAIAKYILKNKIEVVNIYCTAEKGKLYGEEDYYFAEYLKSIIEKEEIDYKEIKHKLRIGSGKGFKNNGFAPYSDFEYCMDLDKYDCILYRKSVESNYVILEKMV